MCKQTECGSPGVSVLLDIAAFTNVYAKEQERSRILTLARCENA
jgi:hypothetical protein